LKKFEDLSAMEKEELIADAQAALNSSAVKFVFQQYREECIQELLNAEVGGLTAATAHASMKVLAGVEARLQSIVNEKLVAARRRIK
jgi:hypothetical protein